MNRIKEFFDNIEDDTKLGVGIGVVIIIVLIIVLIQVIRLSDNADLRARCESMGGIAGGTQCYKDGEMLFEK